MPCPEATSEVSTPTPPKRRLTLKQTPGEAWRFRDTDNVEAGAKFDPKDPRAWRSFRVRDLWVRHWIKTRPADYFRKGMTYEAKKEDGRTVWSTLKLEDTKMQLKGVYGQ